MVNSKFIADFNKSVKIHTELANSDSPDSNIGLNVLYVLDLINDRMQSGWYDEEDTFDNAYEEAKADIIEADQMENA